MISFPETRRDNYRENGRRIAENDKPEQIEDEAYLAHGKHHYFLANKFPLHDDNELNASHQFKLLGRLPAEIRIY